MTASILPDTVLGGRYRLVDRLDQVDGAKSWRAVDQVLERSVAAFVVDRDDPRVGPLLDAARRSATVTDPHVLRVLDADADGGLAWVINEWGSGQSLDVMVAHEPLAADRAAWLVREVAAAIAVAHRHGLAHGRLAPENVMVTESGTVRLIGFAIDATIQRDRLRSGNYPGCTPREADLYDLAGLLYAALVGCWPGASGSLVKPAPRDARGPLRPRQVRAGVPTTLDAICGRVLARSRPDRTAHQLSAVLTEYIGELAAADPTVLPVALPEMDSSLDDLAAVTGQTDPDVVLPTPDRPVVPADPDDTTPALVTASFTPVEEAWDDVTWSDADTLAAAAPARETEPESEPEPEPGPEPDPGPATERSAPVFDPSQDADWHRPRPEAGPPAPPLEPAPERPLFAPEGTRRTPRGEAHRSVTTDWGTEVAAARIAESAGLAADDEQPDTDGGGDGWSVLPAQRRPSWPLGSDDDDGLVDDWEERTRRPWLRLPLVVTVLAVLAVLVAGAITLYNRAGPGADRAATGGTSASPGATTTSGQRIRIASVKDLDPFAVPPQENPDEVGNAIDGNPATSWQTVTYRGRPDLGGLKPGVGLVADLGAIRRIGSLDLTLVGAPSDVTVFAAPTASGEPTGVEGLQRVARRTDSPSDVRIALAKPVRTRYVVVWLTSLPPVDGGYRGGVAEIVVRS